MHAFENLSPQTSDLSTVPFLLFNENRFAHSAVRRLMEDRRQPTDSLVYVYGPSGVGKSHLLRQWLREMHRQQPALREIGRAHV